MRGALESRWGSGALFITCLGGMKEHVLSEQRGPPGVIKLRAGAPLSPGTGKTAAFLGQPASPPGCGSSEQQSCLSRHQPLMPPALSISPQPCWDVPQLHGPPRSCLGTASVTHCLPHSISPC